MSDPLFGFLKDRNPARRTNVPLLVGAGLVLIVLFLAVFGPGLAPKDPREQHLIIQVGEEWMTPPYPAFTPGYPLGSDNLGRDLFSWLLWSVRPTMILVLVVAALRMILGVLIGVGAGWSDRWSGRLFDALIAGALSVPALIASLIAITAIGFKLGIWAFVVGLAITGWAETAQLVRERTREIKSRQSVEAARSLGASGGQIFFLHVLPHVMPMVWMLLAFEISSTLVTTAGLGFLGYYLGGAVFVEVDDFKYQRISEMPELGQMLATAWMVLDEPWAMVAAGTVVFLIVLGFNLIGEGLQMRLNRKLGGSRSLYTFFAGAVLPWIREHVVQPLGTLRRRPIWRPAFIALLVALISGGVLLWSGGLSSSPALHPVEETAAPESTPSGSTSATPAGETDVVIASSPPLEVPGGHHYANEGGNPWHTRWVDFTGPVTQTVQWTFEDAGGFVGGPAVGAEGQLYIAAQRPVDDVGDQARGLLYALSPTGGVVWETPLPVEPVGMPALAEDGTIYVTDKSGGLCALSPEGEVRWCFEPEDAPAALDGPVVSKEGPIYYRTQTEMVSLDTDGELRWRTPVTETFTAASPYLSADGTLVAWERDAYHTEDGAPRSWSDLSWPNERGDPHLVIGADGTRYYRIEARLYRGASTEGDASGGSDPLRILDWTVEAERGEEAGVTASGRPWLWAPGLGRGMAFLWGKPDGSLDGHLSRPNTRNVELVGVDAEDTAFICADYYVDDSQCMAYAAGTDHAAWYVKLQGTQAIAGAALAPRRLYVATRAGELVAVGPEAGSGEGSGEGTADPGPQTRTPEPTPSSEPVDPGPAWAQPQVPGGHPWSMPQGDPWGTRWADLVGPRTSETTLLLEREGGFSGGPVVDAAGNLYAGTQAGELVALDAQGQLKWQVPLKGSAVGSPAIGADGTIYATDWGAYLTAVTPEGEIKWRYHATGVVSAPVRSRSGQLLGHEETPLDSLGPAGAGPTVAPDGTIYFTMGVDTRKHEANTIFRTEVLLGVSPKGESVLNPPPFTWSDRQPLRVGLWGDALLVSDAMRHSFSETRTGRDEAYGDYFSALYNEYRNLTLRIAVGADGRYYHAYRRTLASWYLTDQELVIRRTFTWEPEESPGSAVGVGALPSGTAWLSFRGGKFVWITPEDDVIGPVRFPLESSVYGLDREGAVYGCGSSMGKAPECMAYTTDSDEPVWHVILAEGDEVVGAALAPGRLYVTTQEGRLIAIGSGAGSAGAQRSEH